MKTLTTFVTNVWKTPMDLNRIMNIISLMPQKHQKAIMTAADFVNKTPKQVLCDVIDSAIALCRNAAHKEVLMIYKEMPISDDTIVEYFGGMKERHQPLSFTDEQIEFIKTKVYRNLEGKFRIIPNSTNVSIENLSIAGLECDDSILEAKLTTIRKTDTGMIETFDGLKQLRKQHYEPPYEGVYAALAPNLQRIKIISSFEPDVPVGFFKRDNKMYRNVCHKMTSPNQDFVCEEGLERAMLLMYLVSGANTEAWNTLYNLIHFMVRVPNSPTGFIIYLNDFDAGGNGKSKFVSVLQRMFGESFTAFEPHQLRFNISLMGKRLVHISEYEDNETSRQLQSMLKAMTGRDKFQYEGKGVDPIVAETYQNFIISSNRYIYFEDAGIKRRLQNFHCSNFLHLLLTKYFKSPKYLDKLLGNNFDGSSQIVANQMAHSLLDYILKDNRTYDIQLRPQTIVLGNLRNPILRTLFSERCEPDGFIRDVDEGSAIDLCRIVPDAKPEQYNYAAGILQNWLPSLGLVSSRDALTLTSPVPMDVLIRTLSERIKELDELSLHLKTKNRVRCEYGKLGDISSEFLIEKYFGEQLKSVGVNLQPHPDGVIVS